MSGAAEAYQPFVSAEENPPELTFRALLLGSILGVVFGRRRPTSRCASA
jgi:hypothetical protein